MPGLIDPLNPSPGTLQYSAMLDAVADQAGGIVGKLAQHNLDALNAIQATSDQIAVKLGGAVQGQLAGLEVRGQKTVAKLQKERNRLMGNAYQSIYPHGGSWQPIEHIAAGVAAGDIFGPVGLVGPGQQANGLGAFGELAGDGTIVKPIAVGPPPLPVYDPAGGAVGFGAPVVGPAGFPVANPGGPNLLPPGYPGNPSNPGPGGIVGTGGPGVVPPGTQLPPPGGAGNGQGGCAPGQTPTIPGFMGPYPMVPGVAPCCPPGWTISTAGFAGQYICLDLRGQSVPPGPWAPPPTGEPPPWEPPTGEPPSTTCPPCEDNPPLPPDPTCPPPATAPACPPGPSGFDAPGDQGDEYCDALAKMIASIGGHDARWQDWLGMAAGKEDGSWVAKAAASALTGNDQPILPALIARFKEWAGKANRAAVESLGCGSGTMLAVTALQGIVAFIQKWTDVLPPQLSRVLEQSSNTLCQSLIPTQAGADIAYLNNTITEETWRCFTQAHGNFQKPAGDVMWAQRTKPNAREVDLLFRRGLIDQDAFNTKMRNAGCMTADDAGDVSNLNLQFPDRADLIRFMVRDVFDENVVTLSGLDTDFEKKFTGDALKYADALGIPQNHLRYAWRAHWQLPSLTMAGQMLARCRPGRVPDDAVVTEADVVQLLKQDDWAPAWIPSMLEIVKQPLTRVDIRRMYQLHQATEAELKEYYLDLRYDDAGADKQVAFAKAMRDVAEAKASGLPTQRTAIMQYARGEMTSDELTDVLREITMTPELANRAFRSAELARTVYRRRALIAGVRKQYVAGLVDDGEAAGMLSGGGVDAADIAELFDLWNLDKRDKGKHASAAQLCAWRADNLITPPEQLSALMRTGWTAEDANRIVSQCDLSLSVKARKTAESAAKEAMKQMEKANAAALKELKAKGRIPGPPSRRIVIVRSKTGQTATDTTTVPVLPGAEDIAAAEQSQ